MGSLINFKIASLNCNGLIDPAKRKILFELFERSNFQIILLQETHFHPSQHRDIVNEWKKGPIYLNSIGGGKCGTAVLFNNFQYKIVNDIFDNESRVISLDVEFYGSRFHLVNSYMPNDDPDKLKFIENSYKYVMSNLPVIWGGDFNLTVDNLIDRWPKRSVQDTYSGQLNNVLDTFNLVDSCRFLIPNKPVFTFKRKYNDSVVMSRIDKLLVSKHFEIMGYSQYDCDLSDHEIIASEVQYQSKMVFGQRPWRNDVKMFQSDNFLDNFKSFWNNIKIKKRAMFYGNIAKWWNEAKYDVKRMLMTLEKSTKLYEKREISMMKNTLSFLLELLTLNPDSKIHVRNYFEYKKKLSTRQLKDTKEKILREKANKYFLGDRPTKDFFETFKRKSDPNTKMIFEMMDEDGVIKSETPEILGIAHSFYQTLFSQKDLTPDRFLEDDFFSKIKKVPPEFLSMIEMAITW